MKGKYLVQPEDQILLNLHGLHNDPKIWGDDADVFRPERFLDGGWERLPPNAWKAFGDGPRACIGRTFAEQEMIMVVALILQKFQVELADPSYDLSTCYLKALQPRGAFTNNKCRSQSYTYAETGKPQAQGPQEGRPHHGKSRSSWRQRGILCCDPSGYTSHRWRYESIDSRCQTDHSSLRLQCRYMQGLC